MCPSGHPIIVNSRYRTRMVKYLTDKKTGRFTGSIGEGKTKVPTTSNNPFKKLFGQTTETVKNTTTHEGELSYCETVTAGPSTPRHIRIVGPTGLHTGGGADTDTLCGRPAAHLGWDIKLAQDATQIQKEMDTTWAPGSVCKTCGVAAIQLLTK